MTELWIDFLCFGVRLGFHGFFLCFPSDSGSVQAPQPGRLGPAVLRAAGSGAAANPLLRGKATQGKDDAARKTVSRRLSDD